MKLVALPIVEISRKHRPLRKLKKDEVSIMFHEDFKFAYGAARACWTVEIRKNDSVASQPEQQVVLVGIAAKKCNGASPGSWIYYAEDGSVYKRITYSDLGIKNKWCGLKKQKDKKVIHFLKKIDDYPKEWLRELD